jgi:hypothetical protein
MIMTKAKMIEKLKANYPTLRSGSEETGYVDLSADEYEATIAQWADNLLASEAEEAAAKAAKAAAEAKLAALGLTADDLKALGL